METQDTAEALTGAKDDEVNSTAPKPLRRACDCCRKRKVKCDGGEPCGPCKKATIRCAYLQAPKKKGPKGLRSARVLHALRRIDQDVVASPTSPLTPEHNGAFGNWGWNAQRVSPSGPPYTSPIAQHSPEILYAQQTSVAPDQTCPPPVAAAMPQIHQHQQYTSQPVQFVMESQPQSWTPRPESVSTHSDHIMTPIESEPSHSRLSADCFLPYIQLFYNNMFPIMPVISPSIYLDPSFYTNSNLFTPEIYCFLCAICACTVVQLDESIPQPAPLHPNKRTDDLFAEECLRERKTFDYTDAPSTYGVMTSFFMFAYYGNHEKHAKAWHYLQESITIAENLNMEDETSYPKLDPTEAQWRRRLYWLLFVTERGYAVQRRKHTRLHSNSVKLPQLFPSEDPELLNGFVNLANLFSAVDNDFVRAWRGTRRQSLCNESWLAETQQQLERAAAVLSNTSETQQMDVGVTKQWLHILAWQMGVSNGLIWGKGGGGMRLEYPIELAKKVVEITSGANALALDSHGIGMEQKLSDIAGCLADVLRCTAGDTSETFQEGKQYLNILLGKLSSMRGKESRYLKPLMAKTEGLLGYEMNETLPLPTETPASYPHPTMHFPNVYFGNTHRSMADSFSMLRTLSMSGNLGMPSLAAFPLEDQTQRRPSGRILGEGEVDPWILGSGVSQGV